MSSGLSLGIYPALALCFFSLVEISQKTLWLLALPFRWCGPCSNQNYIKQALIKLEERIEQENIILNNYDRDLLEKLKTSY